MRAILYLKQILLTHPHLKKNYFPICAKRAELAWGLRTGGPVLGRVGALGPHQQHRGWKSPGNWAGIYGAITIHYTAGSIRTASEHQY